MRLEETCYGKHNESVYFVYYSRTMGQKMYLYVC